VGGNRVLALLAGTASPPDRGRLSTTNTAPATSHQRLLGNGHCTRPVELDRRLQTMCEGCGFFETTSEFIPILRRQHHNTLARNDLPRAKILDDLVKFLASDHTPSA
jgi:hypothetical protein